MEKVLILGGTGRLGTMLAARLTDCDVYTLARRANPKPNHIQADILTFEDYRGFDTVIHCAAMKDVAKCETHIEDCIATNVTATAFALRAARAAGVGKYIYISTDMAVEPQSVYGASKKLADSLVIGAAGDGIMQTAVVRLGNIIASEGSIFNTFHRLSNELGYVPVTDERMTRFLMRAEDCADFVIEVARQRDLCGDIFAPRCKSYRVVDVARAVAPDKPQKIVGLRAGDMLAVIMVAQGEVSRTIVEERWYRIGRSSGNLGVSRELNSANNPEFATVEELAALWREISSK